MDHQRPAHLRLLAGVLAHAKGIAHVVSRPRLLLACLPGTAIALGTAVLTAVGLWLPCLLLRLPPLRWTVSIDKLLTVTSLLVLYVAQALFPRLSSTVFFVTFASCSSQAEAKALQDRAIVRGLVAQIQTLVAALVTGAGAVVFVVATAAIWLPPVAATLAGAGVLVLALSPLALLVGGVTVALVVWLAARLAPAWAVFSQLRVVSLAFGAVLALCYTFGLIPQGSVDLLLELAWVRLLAVGHATALLAQYSTRSNTREWNAWRDAFSWELAGFGLPVYAVMRLGHPLVGLVLLEVMHGAAAYFLHEQRQSLSVPHDP